MFRRKIYGDMLEWKKDWSSSTALVVKGMRQVGKTSIVCKFAEENYEHVVYIDLKTNKRIRAAFDGDLDVDAVVMGLSARLPDADFVPGSTVLIFDEIQECPNARESIRRFVQDGRYTLICTGSLLGIRGYSNMSGKVSVGSEYPVYMKSMDFEEFLWAKGVSTDITDHIRSCFHEEKAVEPGLHETLQDLFKQYICVGGMPAVVQIFVDSNDMGRVLRGQRMLIDNFRDDFGKHLDSDGNEKVDAILLARTNQVLSSVTAQLARENKKFKYAAVASGGRKSMYEDAIQWLCDYGLTVQCFRLSDIARPLEGNKDDSAFKLYFRDTGLFVSMLDEGIAADILEGDPRIYKGAIYENIVADAFSKSDRALYYYERNNRLEIDFVTVLSKRITLIEVKPVSGHAKSVRMIMDDPINEAGSCIKLGSYNVGRSGGILTIPHYMAYLVDELDQRKAAVPFHTSLRVRPAGILIGI